MSFCSNQILELASGIYTDMGSPSVLSVGYISGWLVQSGNLGGLNNKLDTCFWLSGDSPCIVNGFGGAEASIYTTIYKIGYYTFAMQSALSNPNPWTALTEGDSKIVREGPTASAKIYLGLLTENNYQLRLAVGDWKRNHSIPTTVNAADLASYPTPS